MVISKKANTPLCNISCNGEKIKQVKSFKYLGYTITQNAKSDAEIKKRIAMAKETFRKMKTIFTNRNITFNTKINTLKAYVWSVLLYGCECWTLNKDTERRLEAAELWFLRRMLRISWTEKKTQHRSYGNGNVQKITDKNHKRKANEILGKHLQEEWDRETNAVW